MDWAGQIVIYKPIPKVTINNGHALVTETIDEVEKAP
jgi:hypothetical protein